MDSADHANSEMTLIVETVAGTIVRRIHAARALSPQLSPGPAAEDAARSTAAVFGLPDFVFRPAVVSVGAATREVGDAIVVAGDVGLVVQVKSRAVPSGTNLREVAWLDKRVGHAARQALGTIRTLCRAPSTLVNERGRAIVIDGPAKSWLPVVIVDHVAPPADYVPAKAGDTVVLLRRDWEFLFEQLRSTEAVVRYLHRVSPEGSVALGTEAVRYYELANADAVAEPSPADERLVGVEKRTLSSAVLPLTSPQRDELRYHTLFRLILEDIATVPRHESLDEAQMLEVLAAIDSTPVTYRTEFAKDLMGWLQEVSEVPAPAITWRFRRLIRPNRPQLILLTASRFDQAVQNAFAMYVTLRHQQLVESSEDDEELQTVGVMLTPRHDGRRPWDTSLAAVRGKLDLTPEYRRDLDEMWPVLPAP